MTSNAGDTQKSATSSTFTTATDAVSSDKLPEKDEKKTNLRGKKAYKSEIEYYFAQLTGTEDPDMAIVQKKINRLEHNVAQIIEIMSTFSPAIRSIGYEQQAVAIDVFANRAREFHAKLHDAAGRAITGAEWLELKEHDFMRTCMVTCNNLSVIRAHFIHSWDTVDRKFMNRLTRLEFMPFAPWCDIDVKHMWLVDGDTESDLPELLFTVMKNMFITTLDMYEVYMSPDIDISNLSELIISSIKNLRKHIPRCEKAFNKIEDSARLLKNNFGEYYRDFLQTKDPSNIFTAFISDVSSECGNDTMLILQCRKIVEFYKKNTQNKIASGEITGEKRQIFESLLTSYNILDRGASEAAGIPADGSLPDSDEDESGNVASVREGIVKEDDRDLDELMRQIENPKITTVSGTKKPGKK